MRAVLVMGILVMMGLSGCISDDLGTDGEAGSDQENVNGGPAAMPQRFFEPNVILETEQFEVAKGSDPEVSFYVTDMHDYPFPVTFIDWALFHDRNPNPVAEGDATTLPGTFNQTLFAEDYHLYGFHVDDTQGLKETKVIIIEVGEPEGPAPNATEIQEFVTRIEAYFVEQVEEEVEEVVEEVVEEAPKEGIIHDVVLQAPFFCWNCVESDPTASHTPEPLGARGCNGFLTGTNRLDCAWVNILPASWGEEFRVTSEYVSGGQGSVDAQFLTSCRADGEPIQALDWIDHSHSPDEAAGIIPEGARCLVAFELELPGLGGDPDGVNIHFEWTERPGEPLEDPWFHPTLGLGYVGIATSPWYDGVLMESDVASGCVGDGSTCSPSVCPGLATGQNGFGCAWIEVTENMVGLRFSAVSAGDVDAIALTECAPDASSLGSYGAFGPETGFSPADGSSRVIPEGAGCIYVSDFAAQSPRVEFTVISSP